MKRTVKIVATIVLATAIAIVLYDRSQSQDGGSWPASASLPTAAIPRTSDYRVEAARKTVVDLGRNRGGCTLKSSEPAQTLCDTAVALESPMRLQKRSHYRH
jgi:hypothetical protein